MNVPHDRICPECGSYMTWTKNHYECKCGYKGRILWCWQKISTVLTILALVVLLFHKIVIA